MNFGSPAVYLLWTVLSSGFFVFTLGHLWAYDKFKCLRWSSGRQPGTFKRVMTYSYVLTLPLFMIYSISMTVIKYQEGWVSFEGFIIPRPVPMWSMMHQRWITALYFVLSISWALELITHLEELTFWLFLIHQGPRKREWFESWEFRCWYIGSAVAIIGMPLIALIKRDDRVAGIAWIFLFGSAAGAFTTLCFCYVLCRFPRFVRQVESEGADGGVIGRLTKYYKLNAVRISFRFMFHFPLLIIGADGVALPLTVLHSLFWTDLFITLAGIGCFVSSAMTLLLFFPLNLESSVTKNAKSASPAPSHTSSLPRYTPRSLYQRESTYTYQEDAEAHHDDVAPLPTPSSPHEQYRFSPSPPPPPASFVHVRSPPATSHRLERGSSSSGSGKARRRREPLLQTLSVSDPIRDADAQRLRIKLKDVNTAEKEEEEEEESDGEERELPPLRREYFTRTASGGGKPTSLRVMRSASVGARPKPRPPRVYEGTGGGGGGGGGDSAKPTVHPMVKDFTSPIDLPRDTV